MVSYRYILTWWASGIIDRLRKEYFPKSEECRANSNPQKNYGALNLSHLTFSFVLLVGGLLVSILAFLFENLMGRM